MYSAFCSIPYFSKIFVAAIFLLIAYSSCGFLIQLFNIYCGSGAEFTEKGRLEQKSPPELWRRDWLRLHISGGVVCAKSK